MAQKVAVAQLESVAWDGCGAEPHATVYRSTFRAAQPFNVAPEFHFIEIPKQELSPHCSQIYVGSLPDFFGKAYSIGFAL